MSELSILVVYQLTTCLVLIVTGSQLYKVTVTSPHPTQISTAMTHTHTHTHLRNDGPATPLNANKMKEKILKHLDAFSTHRFVSITDKISIYYGSYIIFKSYFVLTVNEKDDC